METVDPVAELARGFGRCYAAKYTLLLTFGAKRVHHVKGLTKETCVCVCVWGFHHFYQVLPTLSLVELAGDLGVCVCVCVCVVIKTLFEKRLKE